MLSQFFRLSCLAAIVLFTGLAACGGQTSADVLGKQGSAIAATGKFKSAPFIPRDAASIAIPASANLGAVLAVMFSDKSGICQQANSTFDPNGILYLAVLFDAGSNRLPANGTYLVVDPSKASAGGSGAAGAAGAAEVLGLYNNDTVMADAGTVTISLLDATTSGTAAGSIDATLNGQQVLNGHFEAPTCAPLGVFIRSALGL